jgi:hypothetical protein
MTNLFKAVNAAAEAEARLPWDHELPAWYEQFRDENGSYKTIEDRGLKRATLNEDETGFRERKYQKDAWVYMNAPGYIIRTEVNGKIVAHKYFFDFKDPAETELMNAAISENAEKNRLLNAATIANGIKGHFLTTLRPSFAPLAMVKDVGERLGNQVSGDRYRTADGGYVSGPKIARRMVSLAFNLDFLAAYVKSYARGKKTDGVLGKLVDEFKGSSYAFSVNSHIKANAKDVMSVNPKEMAKSHNAFMRALLKLSDTRGVKAARRLVDGWNETFGNFGASLQYAAMRLEGLKITDAGQYTQDMMNFHKKGSLDSLGRAAFVFYRPVMQGGANMMRALLPGEKTTPAARWRGAVTYAALTAMAFMLHTFLRSLADDDEDGINKYDALPFETISRSMVFVGGDLNAKAPVAFGFGGSAWTNGAALSRLSRGLLTPQQAASHMMLGFARQTAPETFPGYAFSDDPTAFMLQTLSPFVVRTAVDLAVNKDFYGQPIVTGRDAPGLWDYEKGRADTAPMWHNIARILAENLGIDEAPEFWEHAIRNYSLIPIEAIFGEAANKTLLPDKYPTARTLYGRLFSLAGLDSVVSAEADSGSAYFYLAKDRFDRGFRRTGIRTEGDELGSTHEEKVRSVQRNMRGQGYSSKEVRAYGLIMDAKSELDGLKRDFNKAAKKYKFGTVEPSGAARREYQAIADKMNRIYAKTGSKLYDMNLFEEGLGSTARDRDEEAA